MQKKKVVLFLTDSVALPRAHQNGMVSWEDTYISKIKEVYNNYTVINCSIGGASIVDLRNQVNYYKILNPAVVILQCGIVDASPRAFGRIEMEVIKKLKLFRLTKPFVSFLRKHRAHHYTNLTNFEKKLIEIKKELNCPSLYALGIIPSNSVYEEILPGVSKSIENYNAILKKHTFFVSLEAMPKEGVLNDHHHINAIGQQYIFEQLCKNITV